jgi:hypothetical protein
MGGRDTQARRPLRLVGLLLVIVTTLSAQAEPPSSKIPGRQPDSKEPWGAFLGKAAHAVIGTEYRLQHPSSIVFLNNTDLFTIVEEGKLGDPKRLSGFVRRLRPDITDVRLLVLYEIKPDDLESREEGRVQVGRYLAALNTAVRPDRQLVGGSKFEGSLFLEFENGGALWQLSWHTPEPGVTLYRWSSRRKKPQASWKERAAQKAEVLPKTEAARWGELAEQAIQAAYGKGEWPEGFQGQVYLPVDCR